MLIFKTKSLTSENFFKTRNQRSRRYVLDLLSVFQRFYDHAPDSEKQTLRNLLDLIIILSDQVHASHRQAESSIDYFKIYIKALERSYKSVDDDFDKTVAQPAEREAEEKDQEEEERAKGIEEYSKHERPKFYE
jgi:hypothetical protein